MRTEAGNGPVSMAFAPSRTQISWATSLVMRSSGERPMKCNASPDTGFGQQVQVRRLLQLHSQRLFNVPSKTASPVVFTKSARTTVSFSVRAFARRERRKKPTPIKPMTRTATTAAGIFHDFFDLHAVVLAGSTVPDETAATAAADPEAAAEGMRAAARPRTGIGNNGYGSGTRGHRAPGICVSLQALQVGANIGRVLVTQVAIFFERFIDDVFKFRRQIRIQPDRGHGRAIQNRLKDECRSVSSKRHHACRHLVEHGSKGKEIGASVEILALGLLGRHVRYRTDSRTGTREMLFGNRSFYRHSGRVGRLAAGWVTFASPKSRTLACPRASQKYWQA